MSVRDSVWMSVRRFIASALITGQIVLSVPSVGWARPAGDVTEVFAAQDAPTVTINKTVPGVSAAPTRPVFSAVPLDGEILRARVLPEPLLPVRATEADENVALGTALLAYHDAREPNTLGAVTRFMEARPTSAWQPSLLLNAGLVMLRQGFFTRAGHDFRAAWNLAKGTEGPNARAIADQAVGQLLWLESRLGHADVLEALLAEIGERALSGASVEQQSNAKQALWVMRNAPAEAFRCGPYALAQMLRAVRGERQADAALMMTRAGENGISLARLAELANAAGLSAVPVERSAGEPLATPSVVHFKSGHFAAVIRFEAGRYLLRDATLGGDIWMNDVAVQEEASGAMLVTSGQLPTGSRAMTSSEAAAVWGRGFATGPDPQGPNPGSPPTPPCPCGNGQGMATYRAHLMEVSLNVYDTPIGYTPPVGPPVQFTVMYNQRESHQPQTFTYSNFGARWTFDWLSYITDDPMNTNAAVALFRRGGSEQVYPSFEAATGRYAADTRDHTVLTRVSSSPVRYERALPDGSKEIFAHADGATAYPRRIFMTQVVAPQGQTLTLTYDAQSRLVSVADALGQVTTIAYERAQNPWAVTKVIDPFGRTATFAYDETGRLARITDVIGVWSAFTYAPDGFVTSLTTPYGTSRFVASDNGFNRTLEMTDPMGGKERIEYRANDLSMAAQDPAGTVPNVAGLNNNFLQYRNTFYWDRKAMAVGAGDTSKAHLYHWLHVKDNINQTVAIIESEREALESRVWYLYQNQAGPVWEGDGRSASVTARVLDDGTTQSMRVEYNVEGQVTRRIDPLGRETRFSYSSNGIDLLKIEQKNGSGYDLLESRTYNGQHEPLTVQMHLARRRHIRTTRLGKWRPLLTQKTRRQPTPTIP